MNLKISNLKEIFGSQPLKSSIVYAQQNFQQFAVIDGEAFRGILAF
jgi:hypothetical protein